VNFSEQPPSEQWAALTYRGDRFAEVWFKPEGAPLGLTFRIPQKSFQVPGMAQRITTENLLKAVAIVADQVESWCIGAVRHAGMDGSNPEFRHPIAPPPQDTAHLNIHVTLKAPQAVAPADHAEPEVPLEKLQDLEARWNAVLSLEAAIDQLRLRVESAQAEMESAAQRNLTMDEKVHALNADVHQWNKAKSRARFAVPKAKEFVHRATWAIGTPERKKLGELFKDGLRPDIPVPNIDKLPEELAKMVKHHQVLSAQGGTVFQECKAITAEIQAALRTLLSNSATNAKKSRVATHKKGKYV
jgi:hypothetical protein